MALIKVTVGTARTHGWSYRKNDPRI